MIIKPPDRRLLDSTFLPRVKGYILDTVFLAGSIEMGAADNWQEPIGMAFKAKGWTVFNPRRDDWDPTWVQSIDNPQFRGQVDWELDALELAESAFFYFQPGTKSPITLMEFGLQAPRFKSTVVVCPEDFWRKGNVDILADRYGITVCETLEAGLSRIGQRR